MCKILYLSSKENKNKYFEKILTFLFGDRLIIKDYSFFKKNKINFQGYNILLLEDNLNLDYKELIYLLFLNKFQGDKKGILTYKNKFAASILNEYKIFKMEIIDFLINQQASYEIALYNQLQTSQEEYIKNLKGEIDHDLIRNWTVPILLKKNIKEKELDKELEEKFEKICKKFEINEILNFFNNNLKKAETIIKKVKKNIKEFKKNNNIKKLENSILEVLNNEWQ